MSHYIYKKKAFIELTDGRILPLCLCADSSITDIRYDRYGRRHYFHPKSWAVNTLGAGNGLLVSKQDFNAAAAKKYEREMAYLKEYIDKYEPQAGKPDGNSYCYYGTIYPGGGKLKHMKAFYSTRHTIPVEIFLRENRFSIHISSFDPKSHRTLECQTVPVTTVDDLIKADQIFSGMNSRSHGHMCLDVYGLDGAD